MSAFRQSPRGLRALFAGGSTTGMTDGELLERFRARTRPADAAAESAFEALVDRHAAMVWGVCRRSLGRADAEDAFQATFLVLVRRAGSIRVDGRGSAGRWLYGVARKVSARLRSEARRRPPAIVDPARHDDPATLAEHRDVRDAVADELDRLPPKYRRPIELCDFEGLTYEQAGRSLGWPTATIKSRLARGRSRLRSRLERRGLAPSVAFVLAAFALEARAGVPKTLIPPTLRAAALASGLIPGAVARLADGVLRAMLVDKLKPLALLLVAGAATVAAARSPQDGNRASPTPGPAAVPASPTPDPRFTAKFMDGVSVEVLAVGSGPGVWWKPDGTPLDTPPCDEDDGSGPRTETRIQPPDDSMPHERDDARYRLLFQVHGSGLPDLVTPSGVHFGYRREVKQAGRIVPGLHWLLFNPRNLGDRKGETMDVGFESPRGTWEDHATWPADAGFIGTSDDPPGTRTTFTTLLNERNQTVATIVHEINPAEAEHRVTAANAEGREISPKRGLEAANEKYTLLQLTFDLPPDRIREFRLQKRARDRVSIPGIALKPRPADDPR